MSADSQDDMAFARDCDLVLSTVEEGSQESQAFTQTLSAECEDGSGTHDSKQVDDIDDSAYSDGNDDDYAVDSNLQEAQDDRDIEADERTNVLDDETEPDSRFRERNDDDEAGEQQHDDRHNDAQHAASYVGQCYVRLERLRKRKRQQEERVEELVEVAFQQIDALVNTLVNRIQASHAGAHNRFEIADEKLVQNLVFHDKMEKKLRMIASILSEDASGHADGTDEERM